MHLSGLSEDLRGWTDGDVAECSLAISLGIMDPIESYESWSKVRYIFSTDNPLENALCDILDRLVSVGALLRSERGPQYRWNPDFRGLRVNGE